MAVQAANGFMSGALEIYGARGANQPITSIKLDRDLSAPVPIRASRNLRAAAAGQRPQRYRRASQNRRGGPRVGLVKKSKPAGGLGPDIHRCRLWNWRDPGWLHVPPAMNPDPAGIRRHWRFHMPTATLKGVRVMAGAHRIFWSGPAIGGSGGDCRPFSSMVRDMPQSGGRRMKAFTQHFTCVLVAARSSHVDTDQDHSQSSFSSQSARSGSAKEPVPTSGVTWMKGPGPDQDASHRP